MKLIKLSPTLASTLLLSLFTRLILPARSIPADQQQAAIQSDSTANSSDHSFVNSVASRLQPDRKCMMCKFSVSLINYALKTKRGYNEVNRIANNFCLAAKLESPLVCSQVNKLFNHEITKVLSYGIITPNQICGYLSNNTCGHFNNPLDDWEINLNSSASLSHDEIARLSAIKLSKEISSNNNNGSKGPNLPRNNPFRVIHISDTHVDLNYEAGSPAVCQEPLCCRASSTPLPPPPPSAPGNLSQETRAGYWGAYGHCDVPLRTFESTLQMLNATIEAGQGDIEYIIWTGDIQPHDVWAQNKSTATRTYDAVFAKIFEHLPNIKILPTLGNHEMIPVDSFSPSNLLDIAREDSPQWLYRKLDSFWSRWLPAETEATIMRDGFYASIIREGLKVISLNTNFCHSKNFWLFINSTDPGSQLQWLVHELQMSELLHEQVHIIGHIPPGADDCLPVWSANYHRIVRRFAKTITGQFFGHTHNSEFEIFYNHKEKPLRKLKQLVLSRLDSGAKSGLLDEGENREDSWDPISVSYIGSSVTTFVGLNPSFTIYNIDPSKGFAPVDMENYHMNLTQANANGHTQSPQWHSTGKFSQRFGISDTSAKSLHGLLVDIANNLQLVTNSSSLAANNLAISELTAQQAGNDGTASEDRLYELYRLFNSYSDTFSRADYDKVTLDSKRKFICRFLTGQAHQLDACARFIRSPNAPLPIYDIVV